jgi:kinesin family protein 2/24
MQARKVYDKRSLRKMNAVSFQAGVANYISEAGIEVQDVSSYSYGASNSLRVFARKRPLFEHEAQAGEFDVIRITKEGAVVHSCLMKADLRTPYLATHFCPGASGGVPGPSSRPTQRAARPARCAAPAP